MRIDKELKNSFLLSFLFHILAFLIFNTTISPKQISSLKKSEISFLGSLLVEKVEKEEGISLFLKEKVESLLGKMEDTSGSLLIQKQVLYLVPEKPYIEQKKRLENISERKKNIEEKLRLSSLSNFNKHLPSGLKVLFSSDLGYISYHDEVDLNFKMRFYISEEGIVNFIEPLLFSGNPELDIFIIKMIKGWSFLPQADLGKWYELEFSPKNVAQR